jgi:hypothetical protein
LVCLAGKPQASAPAATEPLWKFPVGVQEICVRAAAAAIERIGLFPDRRSSASVKSAISLGEQTDGSMAQISLGWELGRPSQRRGPPDLKVCMIVLVFC